MEACAFAYILRYLAFQIVVAFFVKELTFSKQLMGYLLVEVLAPQQYSCCGSCDKNMLYNGSTLMNLFIFLLGLHGVVHCLYFLSHT